VTSTDIAENQLKNASKIANANGWEIDFRQADSMTLDGIPDSEFDLAYTSNGVHVWIKQPRNDVSGVQ
jgi:ubiquinone/menaquinone biosynthesis C-methylase UbiE